MFWNGNTFTRNFHSRPISRFPQLFTFNCSNIHSNKAHGRIKKINFYNRNIDKLQIDPSQNPVKRSNLCEKVFDALGCYSNEEKFFLEMIKVRKFAKKNLDEILGNINNLQDSESSIRAELRFELKASSSMFALVDNIFTNEFLNQHTTALSMENVCDLYRFSLILLYTPIFGCLSHINGELQFNTAAHDLLEKYIPTLSVFESLLENTLFGGSFKSHLTKAVWTNQKAGEDLKSLKMEKTIMTYHRLNFIGSQWNNDFKLLIGSNKLFEILYEKFKVKRPSNVRESYQLLIRIESEPNINIKAQLLWKSYFSHLFSRYKKDFKLVINENNIYSLENLRISNSVFTLKNHIGFLEAFNRIFDTDKLDNFKGGRTGWKIPYLICYQKLIKDNPNFKDELDLALLEYARSRIEFVHLAGPKDRFFKGGSHAYVKLSSCPEYVNNPNIQSSVAQKTIKKKVIRKKTTSTAELVSLCIGLNYFRDRKTMFKHIFKSKFLGFGKEYPLNSSRKFRDNLNIRKLYVRSYRRGDISIDNSTGYMFCPDSTVEACIPRSDINYSEGEGEMDSELESMSTDNLNNIVTVNLPKYNDNILTLIKPIAVQAEQYVTIHHKDAVLLEESNRKMNIFIENLGKSPKKKKF